MNTKQDLEDAARAAHAAGWTWTRFWREHGEAMRRAEPINRRAYHKLADHLLALVVSGNTDGHTPIDDDDVMAGERDDQPVDDVTTRARPQGFLFDARPLYE